MATFMLVSVCTYVSPPTDLEPGMEMQENGVGFEAQGSTARAFREHWDSPLRVANRPHPGTARSFSRGRLP